MKFKNYTRATVATVAAMLVFAGCGKDPSPTIEENGSFILNISDVTSNSAKVTVAPTNTETMYYVNVIKKADYTTDDAQAAKDLITLKAKATAASMSLEAYLATNLNKGVKPFNFTLDTPNTDYYAYVYGLGTDGVMTTTIDKKEFTAKPTGGGGNGFNIIVENIKTASCTVSIDPEDTEAGYFWHVEGKSVIDDYGGIEQFQAYFQAYTEALCARDNCTPADLAETFTSFGSDNSDITELEINTDYYAFAFNIDDQFNKTGDITYVLFKTKDITPSDLTFSFDIKEVAPTSARIVVTPSNNTDSYITDVYTKQLIIDAGPELLDQLVYYYEFYYPINDILLRGPGEFTHEHFAGTRALLPDTDYCVVAFGYEGGATTALITHDFRTAKRVTPPPPTPSDEFVVSITGEDPYRMPVEIRPDDKEKPYMWEVITESAYVDAGGTVAGCLQARYDYYKSQDPSYTPTYVVRYFAERNDAGNFMQFEPSTKYYLWTTYVNDDGSITGKGGAIIEFTTPQANPSAAEVTVSCPKYYDGDALFAADPVKYANARGKAVAPTTITPNPDAKSWHFGLYETDYTNSEYYDGYIISLLKTTANQKGTKTIDCIASWGKTCTFLAGGMTTYKNFGPLVRQTIKFEKSKVSPISDLISPSAANRRTQSMVQLPEIMMPKLFNGKPIVYIQKEAMRGANHNATALPARISKTDVNPFTLRENANKNSAVASKRVVINR